MRTTLALVLAVLLGGFALAVDTIPLSQIRSGMTGYGLTVVKGTEISRFEVEVVDVLDEPGERYDFIIVRARGEAITRSGGIAQGMSGSPIYIQGKLAGALSRAATWSADRDNPLGLVTPIESMLLLLPELEEEEIPVPEDRNLKAMGIDRIVFAREPPQELDEGALVTWPLTAPVMVSNLSPRSLNLLQSGVNLDLGFHPALELRLPPGHLRGLSDLGIAKVIPVPGGMGTLAMDFAPGSPVGVALALGDFSTGALGTVTLVEDGKILAFGHPFLSTGSCRYFLTGAAVFDTVAALDAPYKFGTLTELRGGIFLDRFAGIGGRTDRYPLSIAAKFKISGEDQGELSVSLVDEARLSPLLLYVAGVEAVDQALDRIGPGTATVKYTITGRGLPRPLTRENVFLSTDDIAIYVPWEPAIYLDVLSYNEFRDPRFTSVQLEAQIEPVFRAAEVLDLATDEASYKPGDTIEFTVTSRNWRGEVQSFEGSLDIPSWIDTPYLELRAYGGPRPLEKGEAPPIFESLGDLLDYLEGIPTYDTLTVELFAIDPVSQVIGEAWLYGVNSASTTIKGAVVSGEVSLILMVEGR